MSRWGVRPQGGQGVPDLWARGRSPSAGMRPAAAVRLRQSGSSPLPPVQTSCARGTYTALSEAGRVGESGTFTQIGAKWVSPASRLRGTRTRAKISRSTREPRRMISPRATVGTSRCAPSSWNSLCMATCLLGQGGSALAVLRAPAPAQTHRPPQASNKTRGAGPAGNWPRDCGGCRGPGRHRLGCQWKPRHRPLHHGGQTRAVVERWRHAFPGQAWRLWGLRPQSPSH
jgi:hypothetical protein